MNLGIPYEPGNSTPLNQDYAGAQPSETHNVTRGIGRTAVSRAPQAPTEAGCVGYCPLCAEGSLSLSLSIYIYIYVCKYVGFMIL